MAGALDSTEFFRHCAYAFYWSDLADKTVMDIGCGNGGNSTRTFVGLYPNLGKLIGIDVNVDLIDYARHENRHPKIEYHVADVREWSSLSQWEGQIDAVVSYYCLNCVDEKMKGFENVHRLLSPGGTAAIVFILHADFYEWAVEVGEMYSEYAIDVQLEPPESHKNNLFAFHYQQDIARIGFDIIQCDDEYHQIKFPTDEECKTYLSGVCCMTPQVPSDLMDKFKDDIFQAFLRYRPRDHEGLPIFRYRIAKVLVKKRE